MPGLQVTLRPRVLRLLVFVWFVHVFWAQTGCHRGTHSLEQTALEVFADHYLNPEIFDGECTGLVFDPNLPVDIFAKRPGYTIGVIDLASTIPIDLKAAAMEKDGLKSLDKLGTTDDEFGPVDISAFHAARAASSAVPQDSWQPTDGYLLRFSNRIRFKNRVYLQLWIKGGHTSSGRRIDFEFDESGQLHKSHKAPSICDDWG